MLAYLSSIYDYRDFIDSQKCFLDPAQLKRLSSKKFKTAYHKLWKLDVGLAHDLIFSLYSLFGRPAIDPAVLIRSFILMQHLGYLSVDRWCADLEADSLLQYLIGSFDPPSSASHYDSSSFLLTWILIFPSSTIRTSSRRLPRRNLRKVRSYAIIPVRIPTICSTDIKMVLAATMTACCTLCSHCSMPLRSFLPSIQALLTVKTVFSLVTVLPCISMRLSTATRLRKALILTTSIATQHLTQILVGTVISDRSTLASPITISPIIILQEMSTSLSSSLLRKPLDMMPLPVSLLLPSSSICALSSIQNIYVWIPQVTACPFTNSSVNTMLYLSSIIIKGHIPQILLQGMMNPLIKMASLSVPAVRR